MTFTTQILVVLLYDTTNEKHYRDLGSERHKYGISTFCGATSGGVAKCQLFSNVQAGETVACENIRFSSLFAAGDVSRETSPATKSEEKRMFSQARETAEAKKLMTH